MGISVVQVGDKANLVWDLQEILELPHVNLDKKCTSIWMQLWPRLSSTESSDKTSPPGALTIRLLKKLLENYSSVHQLHRLIAKLLEAVRKLPVDPERCDFFPTVFFEEFRSAAARASEQQVLNTWSVLAKEAAFYATILQDSPDCVRKLMIVVRLTWIVLKSFRIRTTARQEVIQNACRLHVEMGEVVIAPLMKFSKSSQDPDVMYCCLVLVHSWVALPVVLRDRIAIQTEESTKLAKQCSRRHKELESVHSRPDVLFWRQQLAIQSLTVLWDYGTQTPSGQDLIVDAEFSFCWDELDAATESSSWDGNPFDISVESFPVAIWSSLCSRFGFLPPELTEKHVSRFGKVLVRTLVAFGSNVSARQKQYTLRSVSDHFLNDLVHSVPNLAQSCLKTVENMMHAILNNDDDGVVKKSKNKRLRGAKENRCEQLFRIFQLCGRIGFGFGSVDFSFSLIWKCLEFFVRNQKTWPTDATDPGSVLSMENLVMELMFTVASTDPGFWTSVLLDLESVRPLLLEKAASSGMESKVLDVLHAREYRLLLRIIDSGGATSLGDLMTNLTNVRTEWNHLYPVFVDVVVARIQLSGAAALFDRLISILSPALVSSAADFFTDGGKLTAEQSKFLGCCLHSARSALQKLRSNESFKKRAESLGESVDAILTKERIKTAWSLVHRGENIRAVEVGLRFISLATEVSQTCKPSTARYITALLAPETGAAMEVEKAAEDVSQDLRSLDERQLLELLQGKMERLRSSEDASVDTKDHLELDRKRPSKQYSHLFLQMVKLTKASKMADVLLETGKQLARAPCPSGTFVLRELAFYELVVSVGRTNGSLPEELRPLFELLLQRLGFITTWIGRDREVLVSFSSLLLRLMKSSYSVDTASVALSEPVYRALLEKELSDKEFTHHFENCTAVFNVVLSQPRLLSSQFVPCLMKSLSLWLTSILQRARQEPVSTSGASVEASRKALMIRNASFVERVSGNVAKHPKIFGKLVIHLIAVYCAEMQNGTLHPEAKEHVTAGLYRLLDVIDPHSKLMGNATIGVESREIYKNLLEDHLKFHKYRGLV